MFLRCASIAVAAITTFALPALATEKPSITVPRAGVTFTDLGGPQLGTLWGDAAKGPHGSLLRLPAGFVSPEHSHTGTYEAVVISGTVINIEPGTAEVPMEAGSFYRQAGKAKHVTKCVSKDGCTLYITQATAFDFLTGK